MLKSFLKGGSDARAGSEAPGRRRRAVDQERLATLVNFFPIGKKLRYYPEFKKDIVFDTLLVAYCVNGRFVYSAEALEFDASGQLQAFLFDEGSRRLPVGEIESLQFLVPDTSEQEASLDYVRRAELGRGRQFNKGNYISLISAAGARGVSVVDTEVDRKTVLKEGPYANTDMVLLAPELGSLTVTDQRRQARARTCVPVMMEVSRRSLRGPCTLVDMSEAAVRIRVRDGEVMPAMERGEEVLIELELGEDGQRYLLRGSVFRRSAEACVVKLLGRVNQDGALVALSPLELLELKARLINYGK